MRILLISSSARGHALADALSRSSHKPEIFAMTQKKNPGIEEIAAHQEVSNYMDLERVLSYAKKYEIDFAVIGPEDPICVGVADALSTMDVPCVAPLQSPARIESSKQFARDLMQKYSIDSSPIYRAYTRAEPEDMYTFIDQELGGEFVIKYDALKGGKGVKLSGDHLHSVHEGVQYALECIEECGRVVIEEKLIGIEFSLLSFVSGLQVVDMPAVQDHKRAYEGDTGPNTGGMGTYSDSNHSLPFLSKQDLAQAHTINCQVAEALQKECGVPYTGILYGGFMAVRDGIRVIEYNCRFGDPEALNILPLLESDFVDICLGIIEGTLDSSLVHFKPQATVCKYITPDCYPESKERMGEAVTFPAIPNNARIYFGDVEKKDTMYTLGGSRTAGIVGIGDTIKEAQNIAEDLCMQVNGPIRHRSDIGTKTLIDQRITTLKQLRSEQAL